MVCTHVSSQLSSRVACRRRLSLALCALAALSVLATAPGCNKVEAQAPPPSKPPEVFFCTPTQQTVTEYEEFSGRTWAIPTVELRARVSGYLDKALFTDGAEVNKDDLLFEVDPRPFQAEYDRTTANVQQAKAHFDRLDREVVRDRPLVENRTITPDQWDEVTSDRAEAEATWKAAIAAQTSAKRNLDFTKISAPFSGRISARKIDPGNLVKADDTMLATLVSLDPIYAYFDLDERTVLKMRQTAARRKSKTRGGFERGRANGACRRREFHPQRRGRFLR